MTDALRNTSAARALDGLWSLARFLNTHDTRTFGDHESKDAAVREALRTPADLGRFLRGEGLLARGAVVSRAHLKVALELRESLRAFLDPRGASPHTGRARKRLNAVAAGLPLVVEVDGLPRLAAPADAQGALSRLWGFASTATDADVWPRFKLCAADDCGWAFVDESKNRLGRWCSMNVCGSRVKSRSYRARQSL